MSAPDRRTALLDAAVSEIARSGTRGMRIERVAAAAGVSPALIYHHFGDRSTLLQRALEHIGDRADRYTSTDGTSTDGTSIDDTSSERVLAVLLGEIQDAEAVRTNSAAWGELRDAAIFDESLRPVISELTARWAADIAALVRAGQGDGSISAEHDAAALGVQLTALVEGISSRWLTGQLSTADARAHVSSVTRSLLR